MADEDTNPRAVLGGNNPPISEVLKMFGVDENFSKTIADHLREEYKPFIADAAKLRDEARALPDRIEDKETRDLFPSLIKRMRDIRSKFEAFHKKEKEVWLRGGQGCDQVFFGEISKLSRRNKDDNAGAADVLNARLTDYDNRVLAAEQERRRLEAQAAAKVAFEAEQVRLKAEREAAELAAAAERARKPETIEAKTEVAQEAAQVASEARVEQTVAFARAEEAHIATLAKPADIMRDRGDDGTMSTMAQEKYAEIEDRTKLDLVKLAPFIPIKALETALNGWAKLTDYRESMPGAKVGRRNRTKVL
jgi:hypothetical protein